MSVSQSYIQSVIQPVGQPASPSIPFILYFPVCLTSLFFCPESSEGRVIKLYHWVQLTMNMTSFRLIFSLHKTQFLVVTLLTALRLLFNLNIILNKLTIKK